MQEYVGERLPDAQAAGEGRGDQTEDLNDVVKFGSRISDKAYESLKKKHAGADEDEELDARRNKTAPVEVIAASTERRAHRCSVRRRNALVKVTEAPFSIPQFNFFRANYNSEAARSANMKMPKRLMEPRRPPIF